MSSFGDGDLRTEMADNLMHTANEALQRGVTEKRFHQMMGEAVQYVIEYGPFPEPTDLAGLKSVLREFLDLPDGDNRTPSELVRHQELVNEISRFVNS